MGLKTVLLASIFILFPTFAHAQRSCLPDFTSLQALQTVALDRDMNSDYQLKSQGPNGLFVTKVLLSASYEAANRKLNLKVHWDEKFDGVSLPYNIFAAMVLQDGVPVGWYDLTEKCRGPGAGLFPGAYFTFPATELNPLSRSSLQIMLWGRIN